MMRRYLYITILCTACCLAFNSCNKWLTVIPEDTTTAKQLFSDAGGFHSALNGLYQELSEPLLYGQNLSWGFCSALSQNYDDANVHNQLSYTYTERYDYQSDEVKGYAEQIWSRGYNVIANCDNLLEELNKADNKIFPYYEYGEKDLIEGEALAIRAFMHFDLLRLFCPSPKENPNALAIRYIEKFPQPFGKRLSLKEFLAKTEADLLKADTLLARCDTLKNGVCEGELDMLSSRFSKGGNNFGLFFQYRGVRMNFVAVKALLARVYAYAGDMKKAYQCAEFIQDHYVKNNIYHYQNPDDFKDTDLPNSRPHRLMPEVLLCLYQENIGLSYNELTTNTLANSYKLKDLDYIFDDKNDIRYSKLIYNIDPSIKVSLKYADRTVNSNTEIQIYNSCIPIIRISELDLIRAEYLCDQNEIDKAVEIIKNLRIKRKCTSKALPKDMNQAQLREIIEQEFRRESIANGQYFFFCKRLNKESIYNAGVEVKMKGKYSLNIPDSETSLL